jgi:hypothetical protein
VETKKQQAIKTNWEDVTKTSVKNNSKPKPQYLKMNDSYLVNELTNAVVRKFPSLYGQTSITIHRIDGEAKEVRFKFLIDIGEKKQEAINTLAVKAQEIGIQIVTELDQ